MRYNSLKCIFSFKIINISAPTILQDPLMTLYYVNDSDLASGGVQSAGQPGGGAEELTQVRRDGRGRSAQAGGRRHRAVLSLLLQREVLVGLPLPASSKCYPLNVGLFQLT